MPRRREERGLRSGGTVTRSAHVMSSRIRGRRYRNVAPDERYGFTAEPSSILALGPASELDPLVQVVSLDGTPLEGATVMIDGTSVRIGSASLVEPPTVLLEPGTATGRGIG